MSNFKNSLSKNVHTLNLLKFKIYSNSKKFKLQKNSNSKYSYLKILKMYNKKSSFKKCSSFEKNKNQNLERCSSSKNIQILVIFRF
jgi:hypothetical protein